MTDIRDLAGHTPIGAAGLTEPTVERLNLMLAAQRESFLAMGPPTVAQRHDRIDRLILMLTENADAFADALNADFGHRPNTVSKMTDIVSVFGDIRLTRARVKAWMRPTRLLPGSSMLGVASRMERVPLGVVGIIGPWNVPLGLVAQPTVAALAGGNNVMIKFSEVTARTADLFVRKVAEYFDPTEVAAVVGGPEVGASFSALPFDHIFFTGSPGVGARVAEAAGRNLVPVTLELGGKNPVVVDPAADLVRSAERVMTGRLLNGGQICLCPEVVFVPDGAVPAFIDATLRQAKKIATSDGGHVTVVNQANYERLTGLIGDARAKGATVHESMPDEQPDPIAQRIAPIVVTDFDDGMEIAHEEIFGPVLLVRPYRSVDDVVEYLLRRPSPLAAYWFGPRNTAFATFSRRLRFGGMSVNDIALHGGVPTAPFGGVGNSGSGAYHGKRGFETFTHARVTALSRLPISVAAMLTPPFDARVRRIVDRMLVRSAAAARRRLGRPIPPTNG